MKQKHFSFNDSLHEPAFDIGQKVFIVLGPDSYIEANVRIINCVIAKSDSGSCALYLPKYEFDCILFPNDYFKDGEDLIGVQEYRVFDNEEKAKEMSSFVKVDIENDKWDDAIGNREDEETIDGCELAPCCANISKIRDILLKCKKYKGLTKMEIEDMAWSLRALEEHNYSEELIPLVYEILTKLGVKTYEV